MMIRALFIALLMPLCLGVSAVAAPVVILAGSVDGQGPGSVVDDAALVSLGAGEVLVFNDSQGQTRTLTGPYEGPLSGNPVNGGTQSALDRLTTSKDVEQSRLGAIRSAPGQTPRELEHINVGQSSIQCFDAGTAVRLWRPATLNVDSRLVIRDAAAGTETNVFWKRDQETVDWPQDMPLRSGGKYLLRLDAAPRTVEITLFEVDLADVDEATIAQLAGAGCRRQALGLLERITN